MGANTKIAAAAAAAIIVIAVAAHDYVVPVAAMVATIWLVWNVLIKGIVFPGSDRAASMEDAREDDDAIGAVSAGCDFVYLMESDGGLMPDGADYAEWSDFFHAGRDEYGVLPLFDPEIVHRDRNRDYIIAIDTLGINPFACEYLSHAGCTIPEGLRPPHCVDPRTGNAN